MRISNNFNTQNTSFRAIRLARDAAPIVNKYIKHSPEFKKAYDELEKISDEYDSDILIQKTAPRMSRGLNFQVIDNFTLETTCYLSASQDPNMGIEKALKKYLEFVKTPLPPKKTLPKRIEAAPNGSRNTERKHKFFGIF